MELTDSLWSQASLPVRSGGLGFRSAATLAPSAFLASAVDCIIIEAHQSYEYVLTVIVCSRLKPAERYECLFVYFGDVLISSVSVAVKAALHADLALASIGSSYVVQQGPVVVSLSGRTDRLSMDDITIAGHRSPRLELWNRPV